MAMRTRGSTRFAIPAMMEGDDEGSPNFQPTVGGAGSSPQLDTYGGASSDGQSSTDSSANSSPLVRGMVGGGSSASQPGTGHRLPLGRRLAQSKAWTTSTSRRRKRTSPTARRSSKLKLDKVR